MLRRHPELRGEAVIVGGRPELRLPVVAASTAAAARGVRPGQPLRQARQLCPGAAFATADEDSTVQLRSELGRVLGALSPAVEVGDEESFCDLSGTHAVHGDERRWAAAIARTLMAAIDGELPAVGVASSRFVARVAAAQSEPRHIRRVAPGEEAAFLAPLPLHHLPIDPDVHTRLAALGLDCLGAVAGIASPHWQRQFGLDGGTLHRLCRGEDDEGVHAVSSTARLGERLVLEGSADDLEVLRRATHRCAADLGNRLRDQGLVATLVALVMELEEGEALRLESPPALPAGSAATLWEATLALLVEAHPHAPVAALRVEVEVAPAAGRQPDLWRGGDARREVVLQAAARLRRRHGQGVVVRPVLAVDPGDLPERRFSWQRALGVEAGRVHV